MPTDEAAAGMRALAVDLERKGAALVRFDHADAAAKQSLLTPDHPDTDAVCLIQSFYPLAVRLAQRRGLGHPRHLQKVTRTR